MEKEIEFGKFVQMDDFSCVMRLPVTPSSITKGYGDVYLVILWPGNKLYWHSYNKTEKKSELKVVAEGGKNGAIVLADRVYEDRKGRLCCYGYIRQDIKLSDAWRRKLKLMDEKFPEEGYTTERAILERVNLNTPSYDGSGWRRHLAEERGAIYLEVPGGLDPVLEIGQAVVCNFNHTGTSYWIVPDRAWQRVLWAANDQIVYNFNTSCI